MQSLVLKTHADLLRDVDEAGGYQRLRRRRSGTLMRHGRSGLRSGYGNESEQACAAKGGHQTGQRPHQGVLREETFLGTRGGAEEHGCPAHSANVIPWPSVMV